MPARRLRQGSCCRRHASLYGAWRRQAVPSGGLFQVTGYCAAHGEGRRCQEECCTKGAVAGRAIAWRMAGANGAKRRAVSSQPLVAARPTARRMAAANAASTRAAPMQSLELPAVFPAGYASSASSPTMRSRVRRNSVARPRCPNYGWDRGVRVRTPPAAGGACGGTHSCDCSQPSSSIHHVDSSQWQLRRRRKTLERDRGLLERDNRGRCKPACAYPLSDPPSDCFRLLRETISPTRLPSPSVETRVL